MSEADSIYFAIATIVAILVGPVLAVAVTRWIDARRAMRDRQWDIFRNLMQYRRTPMNPEFVGALNLVEVEFSKDERIITAWKQLLASFEQLATESMTEEQLTSLANERSQAQTRLLDAIAKRLGMRIEQLDIYSGGYSPKGWLDVENEQTIIRRLFGEIAIGKRAFPVMVFQPQPEDEQAP